MIAITIDCEQWNPHEIRGNKERILDDTFYSFEGNKKLLNVLENNNIKVTFFVTGYFAEKQKQQIKEISENYEVASHGYNHFYRRNKNFNLKEDILKSKKILEKITNKKILGFRAPQVQFSEELIKILSDLNFKYDSSIHTAYLPGFYNNKDKSLKPFKINNLFEIPATGSHKFKLPISWIFFRNLPLIYTIKTVRNLLKHNITPVIYFHSWEFYKIKDKKLPFYYTRNTGDKLLKKLEKFIQYFKEQEFVMMKDLI